MGQVALGCLVRARCGRVARTRCSSIAWRLECFLGVEVWSSHLRRGISRSARMWACGRGSPPPAVGGGLAGKQHEAVDLLTPAILTGANRVANAAKRPRRATSIARRSSASELYDTWAPNHSSEDNMLISAPSLHGALLVPGDSNTAPFVPLREKFVVSNPLHESLKPKILGQGNS